ncbi:hypothetical protein AAMO2058_001138300 [Amorphochlora amoebiformis]
MASMIGLESWIGKPNLLFMENISSSMQLEKEWPKMAATLVCLLVRSITEATQPVLLGHMFNLLGSESQALREMFSVKNMALPGWLRALSDFLFGSFLPNSVNRGDQSSDMSSMAISIIGLLFIVAVIRALAEAINIYLHTVVQQTARLRLRKVLFRHLLSQEKSYFDANQSAHLQHLIRADAITEVVGWRLFYLVADLVRLVTFFIYMSGISLPMTIITATSLPIVVGLSQKYINGPVNRLREMQLHLTHQADAISSEAIRLVETVKSFSREDLHTSLHNSFLDKVDILVKETALRQATWEGVSHTIQTSIFCASLWWAVASPWGSRMTPGGLTSFFLLSQRIRGSAADVENHYRSIVQQLHMIKDMFRFMSRSPTIASGPKISKKISGRVTFEGVSFAYASRPDQKVLRDFNMTIEPGKVTALVGASGAGKSTIASLLLRLYEPHKGRICIDGIDIKKFELESFHQNVIAVLQAPQLFDMTIRENITYGLRDALTDEQVVDATKRARIHKFISSLPEGYQSRAGEAGARLSGGQRQRIAIARALIARPPVLILDEATSSLDAKNEALVQLAMGEVLKEMGASVLVIAHRLSTIRDADQIICLDDGKVVERGDHETLIKKGGYYSELLRKQMPLVNSW